MRHAPKPRERRSVSLYLSESTIAAIEKLAAVRGLERSKLLEALVREEEGREWRLRVEEPPA